MASDKKQIPLRLSSKLYNAIAAWAEDDFRSVNGQIIQKENGSHIRMTARRSDIPFSFAI